MHPIANEKYVQLTTFTKDGRPKPGPVWIADLGDGRVGFTTGDETWKAKRITNTPTVELVASTGRGRAKEGAEVVKGTATLVDGAEFERAAAAIKSKYGYQVTLVEGLGKIMALFGRGQGDGRGVVISLD